MIKLQIILTKGCKARRIKLRLKVINVEWSFYYINGGVRPRLPRPRRNFEAPPPATFFAPGPGAAPPGLILLTPPAEWFITFCLIVVEKS